MQEAAPRAGEQFLLTTKMVMSDGIPLLLALARMESQEVAGLSVAMLQRILSYDTRYKRVVLSVTKDPELIRLIEEGASASIQKHTTLPNSPSCLQQDFPQKLCERGSGSHPPQLYCSQHLQDLQELPGRMMKQRARVLHKPALQPPRFCKGAG